MLRILVVSLSLLIASVAAGAPPFHQPRQPPRRATTAAAALRVRGGGAISSSSLTIDPEVAGKIITGLILTQGTATFLAPKAVAEAYGRKNTTPLSDFCMASWGANGAYLFVVALLLEKKSFTTLAHT